MLLISGNRILARLICNCCHWLSRFFDEKISSVKNNCFNSFWESINDRKCGKCELILSNVSSIHWTIFSSGTEYGWNWFDNVLTSRFKRRRRWENEVKWKKCVDFSWEYSSNLAKTCASTFCRCSLYKFKWFEWIIGWIWWLVRGNKQQLFSIVVLGTD